MSFVWKGLATSKNSAELMVPDWRGPVGVRIQQEIQEGTGTGDKSLLACGTFDKKGEGYHETSHLLGD